MTTRARRLVAAAASTVLLGLGVAACSADGDRATSADSGGDSMPQPAAGVAAPEAYDDAGAPADESADFADSAGSGSSGSGSSGSGGAGQTASQGGSGSEEVVVDTEPGDGRSLIKEGNVALRSTDVGRTIFDIRKVLNETGGEVADDDTQADEQGDAELAMLTVRVPVDRYEAALQKLKALGSGKAGVKLISSTSTTKDVSTEVVDTDVRVALQKRSLQRISTLLDRATSIRDIVSIERELASREADLGSLEKRQKLLADQTSRSTITISVERPSEKQAATEKEDESGFVAGLKNGWEAFQDVTTGLLTGAGALLPFAVLALAVGVPVRLWLRRRQPRPARPDVGATGPTAAGV